MRLVLTLFLVSACLFCLGCQRNNRPYAGVDKKLEDSKVVQPDPARIDK